MPTAMEKMVPRTWVYVSQISIKLQDQQLVHGRGYKSLLWTLVAGILAEIVIPHDTWLAVQRIAEAHDPIGWKR